MKAADLVAANRAGTVDELLPGRDTRGRRRYPAVVLLVEMMLLLLLVVHRHTQLAYLHQTGPAGTVMMSALQMLLSLVMLVSVALLDRRVRRRTEAAVAVAAGRGVGVVARQGVGQRERQGRGRVVEAVTGREGERGRAGAGDGRARTEGRVTARVRRLRRRAEDTVGRVDRRVWRWDLFLR